MDEKGKNGDFNENFPTIDTSSSSTIHLRNEVQLFSLHDHHALTLNIYGYMVVFGGCHLS